MSLIKLNAALNHGGHIMAKNNTRRQVNIEHSGERVELAPAERDGSIQVITKPMAMLKGVRKMVSTGELEVDIMENMTKLMEDFSQDGQAIKEFASNNNVPKVEVSTDEGSLYERTCLVTGRKVFQTKEQVRNGEPPLDNSVSHMSDQFIAQKVSEDEKGFPTYQFFRKV